MCECSNERFSVSYRILCAKTTNRVVYFFDRDHSVFIKMKAIEPLCVLLCSFTVQAYLVFNLRL